MNLSVACVDHQAGRLIAEALRYAYVITDRALRLVEIYDPLGMMCIPQNRTESTLYDLVPELIGSEKIVQDILSGTVPQHHLPMMNREHADQTITYVELLLLPYRDSTGQSGGVLCVVKDVTETGILQQELIQQRNESLLLRSRLTRQNEALLQANAELQHLNEMKMQFVSVAAHELRTPLTPMLGFLEMLLSDEAGPLNELQRRFTKIVKSSVDRMLDSANNLLDLTRLQTGHIELVLSPCDIGALIEAVATQYAPMFAAKKQRLQTHIPVTIPSVLCDQERVRQVLTNLLSNASKYTPEGGHIDVTVQPAAEKGYLQIIVADDGIGIPDEDQAKVFGTFFRAGNAGETGASGAGLGLTISQMLIEQHGGRIWFESGVNQGTAFHFTLPVA